jgi:hypothetical protein
VTSEARRDDMSACIFFLADDPARYRRAMRRHRPGGDDRCLERCGRWPCLVFELAVAARNLHEGRVHAAERLSDYPTQPLPAVTDSGWHRTPRRVIA